MPWRKFGYLLRKMKWAYQRATRGYSDLDRWNLNSFVSKVVAEVTHDMRENCFGYPADLTEGEWREILAKIEYGFRAATDLYEMNYNGPDEAAALKSVFREGMELFSKWFHSLWD